MELTAEVIKECRVAARLLAWRLDVGNVDDAFQEACLAAWTHERVPGVRLGAQIYIDARTALQTRYRLYRKRHKCAPLGEIETVLNLDDKLDALFYLDKIEKDRDLVERRYLYGETYKEIAASVGLTPNAVKQRVLTAIWRLRDGR